MMPHQILDGFKHHHIIHLRCNNFQVVVEHETNIIKLMVFIASLTPNHILKCININLTYFCPLTSVCFCFFITSF